MEATTAILWLCLLLHMHTAKALQLQQLEQQVKQRALQRGRSRQVAFSVTYNQWKDLNVGTGGTLKYNTIITNIGNGYSRLTGHFTAPYSGTYAFFASLRSSNSHKWITLGIYKGHTQLVIFYGEGSGDHWDRGSAFVTTHLKKGDQCYVRQIRGSTVVNAGRYTTFSGMLVAAD